MSLPSENPLATLLTQVCAAMREKGATKATAEYYGSGGSGDYFGTHLDQAGDAEVQIQGRVLKLKEAVHLLFEQTVEEHHEYYAEDNGGGGDLTLFADGVMDLSAYFTTTTEFADSSREDVEEKPASVPTNKAEIRASNLRRIMDAMVTLSITSITVDYSGGGDSGGVDEVHIHGDVPEDFDLEVWEMRSFYSNTIRDWIVQPQIARRSLKDAAEHLADLLIDSYHGGFEDNDGGKGEVTFSLEKEAALIEHIDFGSDNEYSSYEFIDPCLNELEVIRRFDEHGLNLERFTPLSDAQTRLKERMASEDIEALTKEYQALYGAQPDASHETQEEHVSEDALETPRV